MYEVETRQEQKRGCGYRKPGADGVGIYFVGAGFSEPCERLPFPLSKCPTCSAGVKFSRGFTWVNPAKLLASDIEPICKLDGTGHRHALCPICHPECVLIGDTDPCSPPKAGLMWVGEKHYTPEEFVAETQTMGISKKVSSIPRGFKVGLDWIYLAHNRAYGIGEHEHSKEGFSAGIFYVFKPTTVELVIKDPDEIPGKAKNLKDKLGGWAKIIVVEPVEETVQEECLAKVK